MPISHSEKALETLRLLGCDTNGWELAPIEWVKVRKPVPTQVTCPTCHGSGQVSVPNAPRLQRDRCPTCPPRRQYPTYGSGVVVRLVEREVEVGRILWPQGTLHGRSRFAGDGCHCELCGKRIQSALSWRPMLGRTADGTPLALWTGDECARKLFGVADREITMVVAEGEAATAKATAAFWREVPKAPKPVKPAKPQLPPQPSKAALDAQLAGLLGPAIARVERTDLDLSRAQGCYTALVDLGTGGLGSRFHFALQVDARHGAKFRPDGRFGDVKPTWADRECHDLGVAMQQAADLIRRRVTTGALR